ncbi:putative glucan 1,3-beta-glucosidase A [Heracleum sosnowskyi]|uniref:Glucan 1,3-beta-glucosidase A n=1 Tax=Heracleum sosnowskyi TaxID=360622 RepID=A0AAD8LWT2_9APIA|nr:putative glucan 1,3-beta-glucosidase A [Heracleum sosnowskyi]
MALILSTRNLVCILIFCCSVIYNTYGRTDPSFRVKAVNLGGWLVTEGWIKPSLFEGIVNRDFMDGAGLQFKSVTVKKYLCAELGGGNIIVANRSDASGWETFTAWRINETSYQLRVFNKQFIGVDKDANNVVLATTTEPGESQIFQIVRNSDNANRVKIKASNGFFLQVRTEEIVTADHNGESGWGDTNPSVFVVNSIKGGEGEFQVTNGYGPKAAQVMREHWNTFITEEDFKFISENGLNAVRIPVGWWIASDPTPPKPYVGGSLAALDNAFKWAKKYSLLVIVDLHAAPGSQNGNDHSASRDGSLEWGKNESTIQQTLDVIDFLSARYAKDSSFYAIELLNEPTAPGVSLDTVTKYYRDGYDVVRKHSSTTYVIMCNRLSADKTELLSLGSGLDRVVIDVHYYNLFAEFFDRMTVQQHIDYVNNNRSAELSTVNTSNGPLILVGEWVAEWGVEGATKEDYQRFGKAQLDLYGRATFGWAYWTHKNVKEHWSLEWMIKNGYIKI